MTYGDVGGCKEQIEKLKEVVEMPLLHVSWYCEDLAHVAGIYCVYVVCTVKTACAANMLFSGKGRQQ